MLRCNVIQLLVANKCYYTLFARFCALNSGPKLNSSALVTVWRFVIEKCVTGVPT